MFGIYDGFSGLVVQPYTGARENGPLGFIKGVGMGLTGFVLKDLAAIFGPFGYTLKGMHQEIVKGKQPTHFIRKARITQGQRELQNLDESEKKKAQETVSHGWSVVEQVWAMMEEKNAEGFKGRLQAMKERKAWRANGAFENVEMAEKALEARRKGESLDGIFAEQRDEMKKQDRPRKAVEKDLTKGKGNQKKGERQLVQENGETPTVEA